MGSVSGQAGIVTGAGRGIGRAIAEALAGAGMAVAVASRTVEQVEETVATIEAAGGTALAVPTDVTEQESVRRTVDRVLEEFGRIDLLVNDAGSFNAIGPVWEVDPREWWGDVTTNLYGSFLCAHTVLPHMIERGSGKIVNMGGGGSILPFEFGSGYGSSKAGILRLTDTLAVEAGPYGVDVYAMGPGLVLTEMTKIQLESAAGQKWFSRAVDWFEDGVDRPPTEAARVALWLATLPPGKLAGRMFDVHHDLDWVEANAEEIVERDLHTLRLQGEGAPRWIAIPNSAD